MITFLCRHLYFLLAGLLLVGVALSASSPEAQSPKPKRIVWSGEWRQDGIYNGKVGEFGNVHSLRANTVIKFEYVQEKDARGQERWVERKVEWNAYYSSSWGKLSQVCKGEGSVDLGPAPAGPPNQRTNVKQEDIVVSKEGVIQGIRLECVPKDKDLKTGSLALGAFWHPPDTIKVPGIVPWEKLEKDRDGNPCAYRSEPRKVDHFEINYSVSVSPQIEAVMDVKTDDRSPYWQFVPHPRGKVSFFVQSNIPVFFRFKLEKVSRFPGYATNANIDDAFFLRYTLEHFKERGYPNDGPDLVFDKKDFKKADWKEPEWDKAETVVMSQKIGITVTAMDFGAYGRLRAQVKGKCGDWQDVDILVGGQKRKFITIPMDEDGNLIADRMDKPNNGITKWGYKGDPGRDDDQEPRGDGTPGDGFTAFEEYRGFITSDGHCSDPLKDIHFRTDPTKKDLFIAPDNSALAGIARKFGEGTGLAVNLICLRHYNNKREVNFTLQEKGPKKWEGKTISQAEPQHGLHLHHAGDGEDFSKEVLGPPKHVNAVMMWPDWYYDTDHFPHQLPYDALHKLGHAVGIRHHGWGDILEAVILDAPSCPPGSEEVLVKGRQACMLVFISVQHGESSGNQDCPMREYGKNWYLPPSSSVLSAGEIEIVFRNGSKRMAHAYRIKGQLKKQDKDRPGVGKFCTSNKGTGLNALPGDQNHAGDSRNICADQIRVNDVGSSPPVPQKQQ